MKIKGREIEHEIVKFDSNIYTWMMYNPLLFTFRISTMCRVVKDELDRSLLIIYIILLVFAFLKEYKRK